MKKINYLLGVFGLTICFFSAFSGIANAWWTIFPTSFEMHYGTHIGGTLFDLNTKNEGGTMDFQQSAYCLTIRFEWPGNVRCSSLDFKFTDTVSGGWLNVHIIYEEWWVPRQDIGYLGDGDHHLGLWSAWKVNYVEVVLYNFFIWNQKVFIDYLALNTV
ncbi:MAG: hypothetical protein ACFE9Z_07315 [Promethearchaeota archaeon]